MWRAAAPHLPLCESFLSPGQLDEVEPFYPLHVRICEDCLLVRPGIPRSGSIQEEDFQSRKFARLKQIEYLLRTGQIGGSLFWKPLDVPLGQAEVA